MRAKLLGIMIPLGRDKYVLSDTIIAVEPIPKWPVYQTDHNGNLLRSRVLINHAEGEILASRTATTILKSMTRQDGDLNQFGKAMKELRKELPDGLFSDKGNEMSEKDQIIHSLIHWSSLESAIDDLPFGRSKFYKLVKEHGINIKEYLKYTDDSDMLKDQQDDGLA